MKKDKISEGLNTEERKVLKQLTEMKTWEGLKKVGSEHYKTGGVEPIDLYRAKGIFKPFAIASIIKYAARNAEKELNPKDMDKIIHYAMLLIAEKRRYSIGEHMKLPRLKKFDQIEIIWQDTNYPGSAGWMSEEEHKNWIHNVGNLVQSIGYYMSQDKNFINLVGDCEADTTENMNFLRPINIAKGVIKTINKLTAKKIFERG
jgi:hypothetical protein